MIFTLPNKQIEISAALFDLDGTLVETQIDFPKCSKAIISLAVQYKIDAREFVGKDAMAIIYCCEELLEARDGVEAAEEFRAECFKTLEAIEAQPCENAVVIPGAVIALESLREGGVKIGIVTRNSSRAAAQIAARCGLAFDALVGRDDVARAKPNPAHLWRALEILGEPAGASIMTGDHWMDVQSGQLAGCAATIGLLGNRESSWFEQITPDIVVRDINEAFLICWKH